MSRTIHLRDDLTVKTFSLPPVDIDRLAADRETVLAHGFVPRPGHKKLSALWERAARETESFAAPQVKLLPQGTIISDVSGADFPAPNGVKLNWVTASSVVPTLNDPGAGSGNTDAGLSFAMGVSLNRKTNSYLFAGISWSTPALTVSGNPVFSLILMYVGPQGYTSTLNTDPVAITAGMNLYFYLSAYPSIQDGVTYNTAHLLYQVGGQASAVAYNLKSSSAYAVFEGASDAAWTIEDQALLPHYSQVVFEGASAGEMCIQAGSGTGLPPQVYQALEPTEADAVNDGELSLGYVSNGNVTCSYNGG